MQKVKTVSCSVRNGFTVSFYIHDSRKTKKVSFFYKFLNEIFFTKLSAFNFNSLLILKNKKPYPYEQSFFKIQRYHLLRMQSGQIFFRFFVQFGQRSVVDDNDCGRNIFIAVLAV